MNIVLDLDDTLLDVYPLMIEALNRETHKDLDPQQQWSYDLPVLYNMNAADIQHVLLKHRVLERAQWLGDKSLFNQWVWQLSADGNQFYVCTARSWHPNAVDVTDQNLLVGGEIPVEVIITDHGQDKGEALSRLGIRADVFVDDNYQHVQSLNRMSATSWLYARRWNYLNLWGNRVVNQFELIEAINNSLEARRGG